MCLALAFPRNRFYNPIMLSFQLYQLQQVDTRRDQLLREIQALQAQLADREEVVRAEWALTRAGEKVEEARRVLSSAEAEAEAVRAKLQRTEQALYDGSVRNPKDLQDLQREAEALKRLLARREDVELQAMLALDEAEQALLAAEEQLKMAKARRRQNEARWQGELDEKQKALAGLDARKASLCAEIAADALAVYEKLRQSRHGLAVATVHDGACDACGAPLTPALLQAARKGEPLAFCHTCGRILYVP